MLINSYTNRTTLTLFAVSQLLMLSAVNAQTVDPVTMVN
ncbi:MAG: hypothetical protein RJA39_2075, partial [Pseudomonadota bacterium]